VNAPDKPPPPPPPHNIELEQALLGAVFVNNEAFYRVSDFLESGHFYEPIHAKIFEISAALIRAGKVAVPTTVKTFLPSDVTAAGLTINQYLARLAAEATTVINAYDYGRSIYDLAARRALIAIGEDLVAAAHEPTTDEAPRVLAAGAIERLDDIVTTGAERHVARVSIGEAATEAVNQMAEAMQDPDAIRGVPTGLRDLDRRTGGLQAGELVILAGRPGMGKSALATAFALHAAKAGHAVQFFSLEMTAPDIARRAITDLCYDPLARIAYANMPTGRVTDAEADRIVDAARSLFTVPIEIEQQPGLSVSEITARARKHQRALARKGKSLGLVIIDHMHICKPSERYRGQRVGEITEISGGLKELAKALGVPVLALAQLSRQVEGRAEKRPQLSDLRESGAIEQDADVIFFAFREEYYLKTPCTDPVEESDRQARLDKVHNRLEISIAKNRNGPVSTEIFFCDIAANATRDLALQEDLAEKWWNA